MLFGAVANTVPEALLYEAFRSRLDNSNKFADGTDRVGSCSSDLGSLRNLQGE